jgi:hypothetical protein
MTASIASKIADLSVRPTTILWTYRFGAVLVYEHVDAQALVAAGIVTAEQIPGDRFRRETKFRQHNQQVTLRRCKDGTINATFNADRLLALNSPFKRFFGALLADTRLSLVKGEQHA